MKKILVLCTGNSCRSQIAEGSSPVLDTRKEKDIMGKARKKNN
jgi:protein-tyrosine-phosphatase